jgi:uncharacterized protein
MARLKPSIFNCTYEAGEKLIVYNTFTRGLIEVSSKMRLEAQECLEDPEQVDNPDLQNLMRAQGFLLSEEADELAAVKYRYYASLFGSSGQELRLMILPTLWCNLACPYCCQPRRRTFMSDRVKDQLIEFVDNKLKTVRLLSVSWFGGEPLLCKPTIIDLSQRFQSLCAKHGCSYRAGLTTNGVLLDKQFVASLQQLGIRDVQVTLDGSEEEHDKIKKLSTGEGTFARIRDNFEFLCQHAASDALLVLRINCTSDNFSSVPTIFNAFSEDVRRRAQVFFRLVYPAKTAGFVDFCPSIPAGTKFSKLAQLCFAVLDQGWLVQNPTYSSLMYCEVDYANFYQIGPEGDLFLCSHDYTKEESVGNLSEWHRILSNPRYKWYDTNPFGDADCQKCQLLPVCMGGCRMARFRGSRKCIEEKEDIPTFVRLIHRVSLLENERSGSGQSTSCSTAVSDGW